MAKKTITLYDGAANAGVTAFDDIDLNAYESAVFYLRLANKVSGAFTFNLYAHEPVTNVFTTVAGAIMNDNGTQRVVLDHLYEESYRLEFSAQEAGAAVTAVLVVEDA